MPRGDRYSRQSFLGPDSQSIFERATVGIIGLGGGGSHIGQQLGHIGFLKYVGYDGDRVEDSNLNRLVGATEQDAKDRVLKTVVAERVIRGVQADAQITMFPHKWQENPEPLRRCDFVFGCVDGLAQRRELEQTCRRYLIPLIDIGLDVHKSPDPNAAPSMSGQVVASIPGGPCFWCVQFLNERALGKEGARYGEAGLNPQVVWANGVLASTAVGVAVDVLTNWTQERPRMTYLLYDANTGTIQPHPQLKYLPKECEHYPPGQVGDPVWGRNP